MTRPRIAWCSPLQPQRSGVADYSQELLPHLREFADIELVIGRHQAANRELLTQFRIIHTDELISNAAAYDAVIYQVANNLHHHGYMVSCLRAVPGIVVLHDYCLQYLMLGLTLGRGHLSALEHVLTPAHGDEAKSLARNLLFGSIDPETLSFGRPVVDMSRLVIVHSDYARRCVVRDFPTKPVRMVPMGVAANEFRSAPSSARARYGLRPDDFVVASVTGLVVTKRLLLVLAAVRALRPQVPRLRLVIVGEGSPGKEARSVMADLERAGALVRTGWVPAQEYKDLIALADVVVDMRYPSGAETSASLARALAAGTPVIVSAHGASGELPDDCCIKIPVGDGEDTSLKTAILHLAEHPDRRSAMAQSARGYASANLRLEHAARAYMDCIRETMAGCEAAPARNVWSVDRRSAAGRLLVSSAYKVFRLRYLQRKYGAGHALKRICDEVRTAVHLETT